MGLCAPGAFGGRFLRVWSARSASRAVWADADGTASPSARARDRFAPCTVWLAGKRLCISVARLAAPGHSRSHATDQISHTSEYNHSMQLHVTNR
jgi:hypothetical protein